MFCLQSVDFKMDVLEVECGFICCFVCFSDFLFCLLVVKLYICNMRLNFIIKTSRFNRNLCIIHL